MKNFVLKGALFSIAVILGLVEYSWCSTVSRCQTYLPDSTELKIHRETCYQFVNDEKYWTQARDYCTHYGGKLVKIDSSDTNQFIITTLNQMSWSNNGVWIGLHDIGSELKFKWTAGANEAEEPLQWTNWGSGHPKAAFHSLRDCVRMVRGSGTWKWHETPCNSLKWHYNFICQYKLKIDKLSVNSATHLGVPPPVDSANRKGNTDHVTEKLTTPIGLKMINKDDSFNHQDVATITPLVEDDSNIVAAAMEMKQNSKEENQKTNLIVIAISVSACVLTVLILILFILRRRRSNNTKLIAVENDEGDEKSLEKQSMLAEKAQSGKEKQFWTTFVRGKNPKTVVRTAAPQNIYVEQPSDALSTAVLDTSKRRHQELPQIPVVSNYLTMSGTTYNKIMDDNKPDTYTAMSDVSGSVSDKEVYENDESEIKTYENKEGLDEVNSKKDEMDCGVCEYDRPKQMNIYSEIPEQVRNEEECHVYECLDELKLKAKASQEENIQAEC